MPRPPGPEEDGGAFCTADDIKQYSAWPQSAHVSRGDLSYFLNTHARPGNLEEAGHRNDAIPARSTEEPALNAVPSGSAIPAESSAPHKIDTSRAFQHLYKPKPSETSHPFASPAAHLSVNDEHRRPADVIQATGLETSTMPGHAEAGPQPPAATSPHQYLPPDSRGKIDDQLLSSNAQDTPAPNDKPLMVQSNQEQHHAGLLARMSQDTLPAAENVSEITLSQLMNTHMVSSHAGTDSQTSQMAAGRLHHRQQQQMLMPRPVHSPAAALTSDLQDGPPDIDPEQQQTLMPRPVHFPAAVLTSVLKGGPPDIDPEQQQMTMSSPVQPFAEASTNRLDPPSASARPSVMPVDTRDMKLTLPDHQIPDTQYANHMANTVPAPASGHQVTNLLKLQPNSALAGVVNPNSPDFDPILHESRRAALAYQKWSEGGAGRGRGSRRGRSAKYSALSRSEHAFFLEHAGA